MKIGLVEPLKDVENLKTKEEKLKVVKEEWGGRMSENKHTFYPNTRISVKCGNFKK